MSRSYIIPLAILILLGTFLRIFQLTEIPPGLHYDIASNALLTQRIAFDGWRPIFIGAFTGKEVLFFYWSALWFRLLGPSVFAMRLAAASLGILALPVTYFAVRSVFRHEKQSGSLAFGATIFLAFSFMHVVWSRFGLRVIIQPVVLALAIGFLFRGLRTGSRTTFVLAGVFTGLAAHTYLAARLYPIPVVIALSTFILLKLKVEDRRSPSPPVTSIPTQFARYWAGRGGGWTGKLALCTPPSTFRIPQSQISNLWSFVVAAFLIAAPLLAFFLVNPDSFLVRIEQVAPRPGETGLLWQGLTGALGMLFVAGDPYIRYNLPGRPIFDLLTGALFLLGLGISIRRLLMAEQRPRTPTAWAAEILLLVWIPVFLMPTALAVHEIFPSNIRAIGLIPFVFVFPARGLIACIRWLQQRNVPRSWASRGLLALVGLLAFLIAFNDYFFRWAQLPGQFAANEGELAAAAGYLDKSDLENTSVYMSSEHYRHPTLAFLSEQYEQIRWFTGGQALAIPAEGAALYLFPQSAPLPSEWTALWSDSDIFTYSDDYGQIAFESYRFDAGSAVPLPTFQDAYANFGYFAELTGLRTVAAQAGAPLLVDLRFSVLNLPPQGDYRVVADLVDVWGFHWSQGFNDSYLSEQWQIGDIFIVRVPVEVVAGTPPGDYTLAVTLWAANSGENLPALDSTGRVAAAATVGPIELAKANSFDEAPNPSSSVDHEFGTLVLRGYDFHLDKLRPGERLPLALYWQIGTNTDAHEIVLRLAAPSGAHELERSAPAGNSYPFEAWTPDELVIDRHQPRIPRDLKAGEYELQLQVEDIDGQNLGSFNLGAVSIEEIERSFVTPQDMLPANTTFTDTFELAGFELNADEQLTVDLYWQSLKETETDFTVFVHLFNEAGELVAQHDSWPQAGAYPTSLWLPPEIVKDTHTLHVPPGSYSLAIGLYQAATGERLRLSDGSDAFIISDVDLP